MTSSTLDKKSRNEKKLEKDKNLENFESIIEFFVNFESIFEVFFVISSFLSMVDEVTIRLKSSHGRCFG